MTVTRNALASVVQVVAGAAIQFVTYRIILDAVGADRLGLWSIVLATTSASRIGELGISASVTRFVAKYRAQENDRMVGSIIQTAAISVLCALVLLLAVSYPLLHWLFTQLFPAASLDEALAILPYALASLVVNGAAAVFQSGLDGCQRYDLRASLVLAAQLGFLCAVAWLVPRYELVGLAWAQIGQAIVLLAAGWILLRRLLKGLPILPHEWRPHAFREMLGYGAQFQLGALAMVLFDPLTKALLGKFGGLSAAGYYELARQLVATMRQVVVSANQVLVPVAATLGERDPGRLQQMYATNMGLLSYVVFPMYGLVAGWSPLVAEIWLGEPASPFVFFVFVLTLAWTVNALSSPAYFAQMGTGRIFWNTTAHVFMGACNALLGYWLGPRFGAAGVAIGMALSLVLGSLLIVAGYHHDHRLPWKRMLPIGSSCLIAASCIAGATAKPIYMALADAAAPLRYIVCAIAPVVILVPAIWLHPLRKDVYLRAERLLGRNDRN